MKLAGDKRPIGMLDSGVGGASVLAEAMRRLPNEDFVFYGDAAHAPYGDKPPQEVRGYVREVADALLREGCKALVLACNTATGVAAAALRQELALPVIGMEPALKPAALLPGTGRVLVMATAVTLSQEKFAWLMALYGEHAVPVPCVGLMERVEAEQLDTPETRALIEGYLAPHRVQPIKAVVLGCTHYVFLRPTLRRMLGDGVPLLDGNAGAARQLKRRLAEEGLLRFEPAHAGAVRFLSSLPGEEAKLARMLALAQSMPNMAE